jgi:hypothetical protein
MKNEIIFIVLILLFLIYVVFSVNLTVRAEESVDSLITRGADSYIFSYGNNFPRENFTIIVLPDTQHYSEKYPQIFDNQTQWITENKENLNIVFVTHLGDIVNQWADLNSWEDANSSMSKLDDNMPWGILPGDQDGAPYSENLSSYNTYFGYERFSDKNWYGGAYQNENTNNYQLFSAGGDDYLIIHIQYAPSDDILIWANNIINEYSNRKVIISTHDYMASFGINVRSDVGEGIWQNLVKPHSDQIFLVLCGHWPEEGRRTDTVGGSVVHQLLADYQFRANGGNGWLRILEFSHLQDKIFVKTYSPYLDKYETDSNSEFTLDYDMTAVDTSITIFSNSTISQFGFNQSDVAINFVVSGEEGTTGYCNLTIPKSLLTGKPWKVTIDSVDWSFTSSENKTHSSLFFSYDHSKTHLIEIEEIWGVSDFSSFPTLLLLMIAAMLVFIVSGKILKDKWKTDSDLITHASNFNLSQNCGRIERISDATKEGKI